MTVDECASRMTIRELSEWEELAKIRKEENERDERIRRVEAKARSNRRHG